jgi:hypothetical protein
LYAIVKAESEPSEISFQRLSEKIKSLILENQVPWSSIVEVEKARLPMGASVTDKIPLLESIGTSDVPNLSPEFLLQILPASIYSECQAYEKDNLIFPGQVGVEALNLISVLLLTHFVKRPNNPPDERVECDPQSEEDVLANYQPIYQCGFDSAITVVKALRDNDPDNYGSRDDVDASNDNPALGDANYDDGSTDDDDDKGDNPVTCASDDDNKILRHHMAAKTTVERNKSQEVSSKRNIKIPGNNDIILICINVIIIMLSLLL